MISSTSEALRKYWETFSFDQLTLFALISVAVLAIVVIEQEVLRAVNPALRRRNARVLAVVIYPLAIFAVAVIVTRFIRLA